MSPVNFFSRLFQGQSHKRKAPENVQRCTLSVETLEGRVVPAGITYYSSDGTLWIEGGSGNDAAEVRMVNGNVVASLAHGDEFEYQSYNPYSINRVVFIGGDGDDSFVNRTNIATLAWGDGGDDRLVSGGGNDELIGNDGHDVISSGDGNDRIWGDDGNDFILAGRGNDTVYGGYGDDQVYGEEGADVLLGYYGNDKMFGDAGNDNIYGESGYDSLFGGTGSDYLSGSSGSDLLSGDDGDDWLVGSSGNDKMYGGYGVDVLFGESGNDSLYGGAGYDYTFGDSGYNYYNHSSYINGPSQNTGLSQSQLNSIANAAFYNWQQVGLDTYSLSNRVTFRIADLPDETLAYTVARDDGSVVIWVDNDGAGEGWYVDSNPYSSTEFTHVTYTIGGAITGTAATRFDLLTVVTHELGHAAGLAHTPWVSVMSPMLTPGLRLLPDQFLAAVAPGYTNGSFLDPMMIVPNTFGWSLGIHRDVVTSATGQFLGANALNNPILNVFSISNGTFSEDYQRLLMVDPLGAQIMNASATSSFVNQVLRDPTLNQVIQSDPSALYLFGPGFTPQTHQQVNQMIENMPGTNGVYIDYIGTGQFIDQAISPLLGTQITPYMQMMSDPGAYGAQVLGVNTNTTNYMDLGTNFMNAFFSGQLL